MTETRALKKIRAQIMWDRLLAIVEEQAQTLIRTAFSTTVREAGDLSSGVFDTEGRMLAQAITGTPGHVNAMAASVGFFLNKHPLDTLEPGDVLVTNDPWHGTGHLNDFTVVTPVFHKDDAVALFAATSHIADVGGLGFGPDGRQVYEEGINLPIGYLFRAGAPNTDAARDSACKRARSGCSARRFVFADSVQQGGRRCVARHARGVQTRQSRRRRVE